MRDRHLRKRRSVHETQRSVTEGSVLLSVLGFLVSLSILVSLFLLLSKSVVGIVGMQEEADTAYWLARGEVSVVVKKLSSNEVTTGYANRINSPYKRGQEGVILVEVKATSDAATVQVDVEASTGSAVHTISFRYNQQQQKIVNWTDSDVPM